MNIFKNNRIYSYFYYNHVKESYQLISSYLNNKEEVYLRNKKLFVKVKDVEIGKNIYPILQYFEVQNETIYLPYIDIKLEQYFCDKSKIVEWFCVDVDIRKNFSNILSEEKLQEIIHFVERMQNHGFVLDKSRFSFSKFNVISPALSLFIQMQDEEKVKDSRECMIQYFHYSMHHVQELKAFYSNNVFNRIVFNNEILFKPSLFPYSLPVIKLCYNYYKLGIIPENTYDILTGRNIKYRNKQCLITFSNSFESKYSLIRRNLDYSVYNGGIVIYHHKIIEYEMLEKFVKVFYDDNVDVIEQIDKFIINLDGEIIGYKLKKILSDSYISIMDVKITSRDFFLNYIQCIFDLFEKYHRKQFEIYQKDDFEIEKALVCLSDKQFTLRLRTIKFLVDLITDDECLFRKKVTKLFFQLFLKYITQTFGEKNSYEQLMKIQEVRFLPPIIVRELINFALNKEVNFELAINELCVFLSKPKGNNSLCQYDLRFEFDPLKVPFVFDYEVEGKYNLKLENGMKQTLSDGKRLVMYSQPQKMLTLAKADEALRKNVDEILKKQLENVKILGISEVIYSTELNENNMYSLIGYIINPIKGRRLTNEVLLGLTNKDIYELIGSLIVPTCYDSYISFENILIDKYSEDKISDFYIDIWNENFDIKDSTDDVVIGVIQYLMDIGYNPNAFIDVLKLDNFSNPSYWFELSKNASYYCNEHDIYYDYAGRTWNPRCCPVCSRIYVVPNNYESRFTLVFEDSLAKHYKIHDGYYLKVYHYFILDDVKSKIEENIDKIVGVNPIFYELDVIQDCFVPLEKAVNDKNQFVGYIYEAVFFEGENDFYYSKSSIIDRIDNNTKSSFILNAFLNIASRLDERINRVLDNSFGSIKKIEKNNIEEKKNICIDLKDMDNLKNLPRVKSLIRLILQVKELANKNLGFMQNPFEYVFLSPTHKRQVQILNIDFLCEGNIENTFLWTYDYVCEVLSLDDTIEINLCGSLNNLDILLLILNNFSKRMKNYCSVHRMYYREEFAFCPRCEDKDVLKFLSIKYDDELKYHKMKLFNQGGESFIYPFGENFVIKVFKKDKINMNKKITTLIRICSKKKTLINLNNISDNFEYVIPKDVIRDINSHEIFAYVMKKINGKQISILKYRDEVEKIGFTQKDILEILITMGKAIECLHQVNIYIGDLNGRNILFDDNKKLFFIDFDGMGVDEITPEFCTDLYIDPVSKKTKKITMEDDWYSFAIQAFHYLTYVHPFNGIYYVKENGIKRTLKVHELMECRLSLLGDHGLKSPVVAKSWKWMTEELQLAFLNTFEGNRRESIVPELQRQYEKLYLE